jgi:hypothetical protein
MKQNATPLCYENKLGNGVKEMRAVCSENCTKHMNTFHEQRSELSSVKLGGTYSNHWVLKGLNTRSVIRRNL